MKCSLFPFFFVGYSLGAGGGGDFGSGSGSKFNRAARVGSGQTISGTGRVRASVLSPCRPLPGTHVSKNKCPSPVCHYTVLVSNTCCSFAVYHFIFKHNYL